MEGDRFESFGNAIDIFVSKKRILSDILLGLLPFHHVAGVAQHAFNENLAGVAHERPGFGVGLHE